ncbi:hypothetical protein F7725_008159 [Dissostichus mawsoni]|uniref:TCL1 upstream neural differentiation-associated RNA n=1 Tax=Dissostichus mawsoni TaxID=36200 RepID=A0A7J5Y6C2_DISMA|nr:hypothetical protein F7725_008159 [Dissostichus mawsoni]
MKFEEETLDRCRVRHPTRALKLDCLEDETALSGPCAPPQPEDERGMSVHYGKASPSSMSNAMLFLMLCKVDWSKKKLLTFPGKMVNTLRRDEEKGIQDKESKEESILAMLGIIGTILNLVVIIFVYIYTTL